MRIIIVFAREWESNQLLNSYLLLHLR